MDPKNNTTSTKQHHRHMVHEAEGMASGALAGAILGAAAGPPGMVAGAVLGAVAGGVAAMVLDADADRATVHTQELDEEIGVIGGDLGAPNLKHPPATVGAYSVAAAGAAASTGEDPAEGPIQSPAE
jgi:phage tail tape-measure protein